mmetsp:Transcript_72760/g.144572  ORF Transcript_72760/g.144572 Transcript_72760/m.144572 type:complete len:128 (-) Transcript_72760:345-728(-)
MLLVGPNQDQIAHIDFGYVVGARTWFDANLMPIPERFMKCCVAAGHWAEFVNDVGFAFAILKQNQAKLWAVAATFAEPLTHAGFPEYVANCLRTNTPDTLRALVEAGPGDLQRRFKNLHHMINHGSD